MIEISRVETRAHLEEWVRVKNAVMPEEPATVEELRRAAKPERMLLLARLDGAVAGCAVGVPSSFGNRLFVGPRVLPELRGRGVGRSLFEALADHARALRRDSLVAHVDGADDNSQAFAWRRGFVEVDREVEQLRRVGDERDPAPPVGVELATVAARPELLRLAYDPIAVDAYADMPLPFPVHVPLEEWLEEEATLPEGSFVALAGGEIVGYAGLLEIGARPGVAEHGLTAVHRAWRGRGIASALKRAQLHWAARRHPGARHLDAAGERDDAAAERATRVSPVGGQPDDARPAA